MAKFSRTVGPDKNYDIPGRTKQYHGMYIGFVKSNTDVQKMGRLQVWIPEFGSQEKDASGWFTISYSSPFAGATSPKGIGPNTQIEKDTMTSYGFWAVPPDLDNQVIVMFANGDPTRGVMMGCLYQQFMNKMVPGLPADKNFQFPTLDTPTAEYNKNTTENIKDDITRPALFEAADGINKQGLIHDEVRGVTTAGARRESPSEVYGWLTPGPKNPDQPGQKEKPTRRLGGHQFYMDDAEGAEHVRIRTRGGTQLLLDETNGLVYAINKFGTSWIQMDAEGNFDIFSAKSVSIRSQEDINFRADKDIIMEAGQNIIIKAAKDNVPGPAGIGVIGAPGAGLGGDITIEAFNDLTTTSVLGNMTTTVLIGDLSTTITGDRKTTVIGSDDLTVTGGITTTTLGSYDLNAVGGITISTTGTLGIGSLAFDVSTSGAVGARGNIVAGGNVFAGGDVKTASIGLNKLQGHTHTIASGSSAGKTLPFIGSGGGSNVNGPTAGIASPALPGLPTVPGIKTNVLASFIPPVNDLRLTQPVLTMVGRFLTFEPCPEHVNKGGQ